MFWLQPIKSQMRSVRAYDKNTLHYEIALWGACYFPPRCLWPLKPAGLDILICRAGRLWFMPRCQYSSFSLCCLCSATWVFSCSKMEMSHWHMCKHSSRFFVFVAPGDNKTNPSLTTKTIPLLPRQVHSCGRFLDVMMMSTWRKAMTL